MYIFKYVNKTVHLYLIFYRVIQASLASVTVVQQYLIFDPKITAQKYLSFSYNQSGIMILLTCFNS